MAQVQAIPMLLTGPMQRDTKRPLAGSDAAATLAEMQYFLSPGNGYPGDAAANWPSVPSARTPLVDAYLIAAGLPGDVIADPVDTAFEYIWADSTGAGDFFAAARQDASEQSGAGEMSTAKLRSIGMVRLRTPKMLEENLLAPSIVRQLLYKWLGDPAEAKTLAPELAIKILRRCGFTADSFLRHACGKWSIEISQRTQKLNSIINSLPDSVRRDPEQFQTALQNVASQTLGDTGESVMFAGLSTLKRELSARLSDGRCDLALGVEMLVRLETFARQSADAARLGRFGELQFLQETVSEESKTIEKLADRWLTRIICHNAADLFDRLRIAIVELREQMSDRASTLAKCVTLVSERLSGNDEEVWRHVDEGIRDRVGSVLGNLRTQASSSVVGVYGMSSDGELMSSENLLQSLLDHALPLISSALTWANSNPAIATVDRDDNQPQETVTQTADPNAQTQIFKPENLAVNQSNTMESLNSTTSVSIGQSPLIQPEDGKSIRRWDDPATIADAIRSVRPALLSCGGYQRMLLIVGSEPERERLEAKVVEVHNGPVTTTVIAGAAAMLICEAQQIRLADVHSRIVTVAANDQDLMGRLAARNDIDWKKKAGPKG